MTTWSQRILSLVIHPPPCSLDWSPSRLSYVPIPQQDGDLDLLSEPDCAPVPDDPLGSPDTCADNLASEPDEPEQVFGTGFCDNLSCRNESPDALSVC